MADLEKVIKGLECCCSPMTYDCRNRCPYTSLYEPGNGYKNCMAALLPDALALLKEQEPVEPILKREGRNKFYNGYECPVCGNDICYEQNYCSECGRGMKWDG